MTFSADDWVTVIEVLGVLFGVGLTWALYHRRPTGNPDGDSEGEG